MKNNKTFYVTTPIYYPSGDLHIGHAYTTVLADILKRYKEQMGFDAFMLTGADEHGQKIEENAKLAGVDPQAYVDNIVENGFKPLFKKLDIDESIFMRTTFDYHEETIKKVFDQMVKDGYVFKGNYKGKYCVSCEAFYPENQLVDGKCPDHGIELVELEQESYMFKMSEFQTYIEDLMKTQGDQLASESVQKELIKNFIEPGIQDLSLTRTNFSWGVHVNGDDKHVVYVWLDALFNYITAIGYRVDNNEESFNKYWGEDSEIVHIVGKDITRFHCIYWPIFLKAMNLRLPTKIITHGLLRDNEGRKMSKSLGNVIDPYELLEAFGTDAVRFYLAKEVRTGEDGNVDVLKVKECTNAFLANSYGNLVSRTIGMISKYYDSVVPKYNGTQSEHCVDLEKTFTELFDKYVVEMDAYNISDAINVVVDLLNATNKYIDLTEPWALAKDESKDELLKSVMIHLVKGIEIASFMLMPIITNTKDKLLDQIPFTEFKLESLFNYEKNDGLTLTKKENLFNRLD